MILPNFAKNCMKLKKIWAIGGAHTGGAPVNPPLLTLLVYTPLSGFSESHLGRDQLLLLIPAFVHYLQSSGGSRISLRRGRQSSRGNLDPEGGGANPPGAIWTPREGARIQNVYYVDPPLQSLDTFPYSRSNHALLFGLYSATVKRFMWGWPTVRLILDF